MRISSESDNPGYRTFCEKRSEGLEPMIHLDGVEQQLVVTADDVEGFVERVVLTENGDVAHDGEKILREIVYGKVSIGFERCASTPLGCCSWAAGIGLATISELSPS